MKITYHVVGRFNGRWIVRGFDAENKTVFEKPCETTHEALSLWILLNANYTKAPPPTNMSFPKAA